MLEKLGYKVDPLFDEKRTDIIQTIDFFNADILIKFCQGLQKASAVDSQFMPVPSEMPGYPHEEIMASGSFNPGSTIELSCDGPVVEPFTAYMQGGLTYNYGKLGVLLGINHFLENDN